MTAGKDCPIHGTILTNRLGDCPACWCASVGHTGYGYCTSLCRAAAHIDDDRDIIEVERGAPNIIWPKSANEIRGILTAATLQYSHARGKAMDESLIENLEFETRMRLVHWRDQILDLEVRTSARDMPAI